jgi:hypothetical protein
MSRRVRVLAGAVAMAAISAVVAIVAINSVAGGTGRNSRLKSDVNGAAGVHYSASEIDAGWQGFDPRATEPRSAPPPNLQAHALGNLGAGALKAAALVKHRHSPHQDARSPATSTALGSTSEPSETTTYQPAETTSTSSYTPTTTPSSTETTPAPTSGGGSSTGGSSNSSSSSSNTPDYGPNGALGPGSSPDG